MENKIMKILRKWSVDGKIDQYSYEDMAAELAKMAAKNLHKPPVRSRRKPLIAFLRQQNQIHYAAIYENDFEFADKLLKAINCH